jgi:hypothetical protein
LFVSHWGKLGRHLRANARQWQICLIFYGLQPTAPIVFVSERSLVNVRKRESTKTIVDRVALFSFRSVEVDYCLADYKNCTLFTQKTADRVA